MEEDRDDIWQNYCRDSGACVRTNLGYWLRPRSRRSTGKEANGKRKADCSSEAKHANGLQTGRDGEGHQNLGWQLC
jgi:hypothetical protein